MYPGKIHMARSRPECERRFEFQDRRAARSRRCRETRRQPGCLAGIALRRCRSAAMRVAEFLRVLNRGIGPRGVVRPAGGDIPGDLAVVAGECEVGAFKARINKRHAGGRRGRRDGRRGEEGGCRYPDEQAVDIVHPVHCPTPWRRSPCVGGDLALTCMSCWASMVYMPWMATSRGLQIWR
jgi:hypothetical protein